MATAALGSHIAGLSVGGINGLSGGVLDWLMPGISCLGWVHTWLSLPNVGLGGCRIPALILHPGSVGIIMHLAGGKLTLRAGFPLRVAIVVAVFGVQ